MEYIMKKIPQGFISTLLAQKKLSGNENSNSGSNAAISDGYVFNPKLNDKPNFHTPDSNGEHEHGLPFSEIAAMLARKAKRVYDRHLAKEHGEELLRLAKEYEIPYKADDLDIITLRDKVEEFEEAIERANEYGVNWREFGYDLLGIEQEIIDAQNAESSYMNYAKNKLVANVGV
jgi:hypothetical protein